MPGPVTKIHAHHPRDASGPSRASTTWLLGRPNLTKSGMDSFETRLSVGSGSLKAGFYVHHRLNPELTCLHLSLLYPVILIDANPYLECQKGQNRAHTRFFTQGFVHIQVSTQLDLIPHLIPDGLIKKGPETRPSC